MAKQIVISGCLSACLLMGLGSLSAASSSTDTKTPSGSVTLSWDAPPPPVRGYKIFYGTTQGGPYDSLIDTGAVPPGPVQVYTVRGLQPNTRYYFVVRAYNNAGQSSLSNEAVGTAP
ncbi:MAG: fibronectin type III domain-containing protein [Pyrinomonadaceae bacterium]|nr:fibronectin type III domain-containing protein [Pyrinomonadaceae bacterium]